jgi:transketolase
VSQSAINPFTAPTFDPATIGQPVVRSFIELDIEEALRRPAKATRDGYGRGIVELGETDPLVVALDADLAGSTRSAKFADKFPTRFFNLGIAESNMVSWAAGMAVGGYKPYASTFSIFLACRAFEAIRQSIAYPSLNVKLVASHGGITVGPDGASHQTIEDIALMRSLPNLTVIVPSDATEAYLALKAAHRLNGPVFIRNGRAGVPTLYSDATPFEIGKAVEFRKGSDVTILTTGIMLARGLKAAQLLAEKGIQARVANLSTVKPLDTAYVVEAARTTGRLVTIEEASIIGGFGSAVAEATSEFYPVPVYRIGMRDRFGTSGEHNDLFKYFELEPTDIARETEAFIGRTKAR